MAGLNTDKLIEVQKKLDSSDPEIRSKEIVSIIGGDRVKFLKVKTASGMLYICGRQCQDRKRWCGKVFQSPTELFGHSENECLRTQIKLTS